MLWLLVLCETNVHFLTFCNTRWVPARSLLCSIRVSIAGITYFCLGWIHEKEICIFSICYEKPSLFDNYCFDYWFHMKQTMHLLTFCNTRCVSGQDRFMIPWVFNRRYHICLCWLDTRKFVYVYFQYSIKNIFLIIIALIIGCIWHKQCISWLFATRGGFQARSVL